MNLRVRYILPLIAIAVLAPRPAAASFHLMQVEQVIAGVDGHTNIQAIQLRMRSSFQIQVQNARLIAHDGTGANPVVLIAFTAPVANSAGGAHVLAATADFAAATSPNLTPDFIMANPIPASYLPAGSLTFEDNFGTIYWRVSWGGAGYTGTGAGQFTNDADGNFNPDFAGALPSTTENALQFRFASTAPSTNNANDYAVTATSAVFTNNAGQTGTIQHLTNVSDGPSGSLTLSAPAPNPMRTSMAYSVVLPRDGAVRVRVLDLSGRVVRSLVNRTLTAGSHSFALNAKDGARALSNGMYFLVLDSGGARRTQRFVVVD